MKIAIDTQTTLGQKSGFGFYVKNLVDALHEVDPENEYVSIFPQTDKDFSVPQRFVWDQFKFPAKASLSKVDILHQPCFSAPIFYRGKIVITVHDLIARYFPQNIPFFSRQYYSKWMPLTYKKADKIITVSENTKKDIIDLLKIKADKIQVIPLAVSKNFSPNKEKLDLDRVKRTYHTGDKFILDVGTLEPRKNLPFLVKVFHEAVKTGRIEHNLVLTGKKGWYYDDLFNLVKELGLQSRVIFAGYVPEEDLPNLYAAADLFCFPSLYEGFGFPPLEAMASGVPVIAADNSSIPEVVGEAGILLPLDSVEHWAQKIVEVLKDDILRKKMSEQGVAQAAKFSWARTAQETIKVYKEVLGK